MNKEQDFELKYQDFIEMYQSNRIEEYIFSHKISIKKKPFMDGYAVEDATISFKGKGAFHVADGIFKYRSMEREVPEQIRDYIRALVREKIDPKPLPLFVPFRELIMKSPDVFPEEYQKYRKKNDKELRQAMIKEKIDRGCITDESVNLNECLSNNQHAISRIKEKERDKKNTKERIYLYIE